MKCDKCGSEGICDVAFDFILKKFVRFCELCHREFMEMLDKVLCVPRIGSNGKIWGYSAETWQQFEEAIHEFCLDVRYSIPSI
ncbi:hypothetical protein LCGC14_2336810 [marine sediment metagenome]|uniref:Uncharacterized protein n=1 Tax=marine sediment metagenome TaxID=412755 RepID=A0A0F9D0R6_9ZZZZ